MIFPPPNSPWWGPYNESYAINEADYLDQNGDMMYPTLKHHGMVEEADIVKIKHDCSSSPTTVLEVEEESKQMDDMIVSIVVALDPGEPNPDEILNFKYDHDPIRAQVTDVSCVYDPDFILSNTECKHNQVKVL